ncbi:hypothetical protein DK128_12680 [Vibrio cholerae O1 biovar El Tor]|nr:hypothetical protein [Vibrio cholerae O1 biovar El Tor]
MLAQIPSGSPVLGARTSSGYGKRIHPVTGQLKIHRGQDFAVNIGTPIYATADGVVEVTRISKTGSGILFACYMRMDSVVRIHILHKFVVKNGDFVKKGDLLAYSGNSGLSSGPHLHYEIRFIGRPLDPRPFVDWEINNFETIFTKVRGIRWEYLVNNAEQRVSSQLQLSSQKEAIFPES